MNCIVEGLGAIDSAPSGGSAMATIKARLPDSFTRKDTKIKWVWPWLHQVETYMETQHLKTNKERIHFVQNLVEKTCMGVVDVLEIGDTRPTWNPQIERSSSCG